MLKNEHLPFDNKMGPNTHALNCTTPTSFRLTAIKPHFCDIWTTLNHGNKPVFLPGQNLKIWDPLGTYPADDSSNGQKPVRGDIYGMVRSGGM